jgi:hypothetical protein
VEIDRLVPWDILRGADRLSRAIAACVAGAKNALPLASSYLAATYPEFWKTEKAAERWLENSPEIKELMENPHRSNIRTISASGVLEYRLPRPQGGAGRWTRAFVFGPSPRAAIAHELGVPEPAVELKQRPWRRPRIGEEPLTPAEFSEMAEPPQSQPKRAWSEPHIVETENSLWPREVHLRLPFSAEPAPRYPPPNRVSFAAMLRKDEGEGVLLTELLVCQSDWSPTDTLTRPAVH